MQFASKRKGFTLIEILLVVVIIGIMLAVIVPRAWRANIDTKYGLVRQAANELAAYGQQWAEEQIVAQPEDATSVVDDYLKSLVGYWATNTSGTPDAPERTWIGASSSDKTSWNKNKVNVFVRGRAPGGTTYAEPEACVEEIVPPEKHPRNPFNGASYFRDANDPVKSGGPIPGALAALGQPDGNFRYYAFLFQGTDSTSFDATSAAAFHAGQAPDTLEGLRNGVFFARTSPYVGP